MAIVRKWDGTGVSAGALTTSSAGAGDNTFKNISSGVTVTTDGDRPSQIAVPDTSAAYTWRWSSLGSLTTWGVRQYFSWASGAPSGTIGLAAGYDSTGAAIWRLEFNSSGWLRIRNASSATWSQWENGLVAGQRYRIEFFGGSGTGTLRIFEGESETPMLSQSSTIENLALDEVRFGRHTAASLTGERRDDFAVSDTAAEIGAVDPVVVAPPEGLIRVWHGDGVPAGAMTTSSVGLGDNAFGHVTAGVTIADAGSRSPRVRLPDEAGAHQVRWAGLGALAEWGVSVYFGWETGLPSAAHGILMGYTTGGANAWRLEMNSSGLLRLRNASTATWSQASGALVAGKTYRIDVFGGSGSAQVRVYDGEHTDPIVSGSGAVENVTLDEVRFGRHTSASSLIGAWFDDFRVSTEAADQGPLGTVPVVPAAYIGADEVHGVYIGADPVIGMYLGEQMVWPYKGEPTPDGWAHFYSTNFAVDDGFELRQETQSNDNSYNHPDNVEFGSRGLVITGRRENRGGRPFTTGDVLGNHIQVPNYFRIDIEATLPTDYGMWPCPGWMRPNNSVNGFHGELDLCETWTFDWDWNEDYTAFSDPVSHSTVWNAYDSPAGQRKQGAARSYLSLPNPDPGARHRYTLIKTPGRIEYLLDGLRVYCWQEGATYSAANRIGPPSAWMAGVYEVSGQTWYPRFTLQLGGANTPDPRPEWEESEVIIHDMKIYTPTA